MLSVRLKRHSDGSASITCTRADGTVTWQRQQGSLGAVFPPHDLTHFAVETTLGYRRAFYGLIADGWDLADFAAPWPRGAVPPEALEVELIVGLLDTERRQMTRWNAAEFAEQARLYIASSDAVRHRQSPPPRVLTQEEIDAVRARRDDLLAQWNALESGETMELDY